MEFRKTVLEDKEMLLDYIKEHNDAGEYNPSNMYPVIECIKWMEQAEKNEGNKSQESNLNDTYILVDNNRILGIVNIRCNIIKEMAEIYGHIGYGVRPSERRKGLATYMLKEALLECKKRGMEEVILGCHKDNIASSKTIINNNGVLYKNSFKNGKESEYYKIKL
ncbi:MAG: GNAT family N-acetyltransferase [Bacilli bacterium]|nr:GNAT family N-acetyltransferase [Bacilli bacterium]